MKTLLSLILCVACNVMYAQKIESDGFLCGERYIKAYATSVPTSGEKELNAQSSLEFTLGHKYEYVTLTFRFRYPHYIFDRMYLKVILKTTDGKYIECKGSYADFGRHMSNSSDITITRKIIQLSGRNIGKEESKILKSDISAIRIDIYEDSLSTDFRSVTFYLEDNTLSEYLRGCHSLLTKQGKIKKKAPPRYTF